MLTAPHISSAHSEPTAANFFLTCMTVTASQLEGQLDRVQPARQAFWPQHHPKGPKGAPEHDQNQGDGH